MAQNYPIKKTGDTSKKNCRIVVTIKAQIKNPLSFSHLAIYFSQIAKFSQKKGAEVSRVVMGEVFCL
jgi:hypothetical protein